MTLIEQIKEYQLKVRKNRDAAAAATLTTLIGEAEMIGKNANRQVTDSEVVSLIKKFIDNIDFTLSKVTEGHEKYLAEKELLSIFMPVQLNREQLTNIINDIKVEVGASTPKDMGKIMSMIKPQLAGKTDMSKVSLIIKDKL